MRQAGQYLPEYRELREKCGSLELCKNSELAAEVTLMPPRRFPLNATIVFADLTIPFEAMGAKFELREGVEPVTEDTVHSLGDVEGLRVPEAEEIAPQTLQAIKPVKGERNGTLPIGFASAPFTLASYLVEGKGARDFTATKQFMFSEPKAWHALMEKLTTAVIRFLKAQVEAEANALQVFDSWVGCLSPEDYREFFPPHMKRLFDETENLRIPHIHLGTSMATLLTVMKEVGGEVIGLDWRIPLDVAWQTLNFEVAAQGNLDPATLLGPFELVRQRTLDILERAGRRPGQIFNLGHGILPQTDPDTIARLVDLVHSVSEIDKIKLAQANEVAHR